MEDFRDYLEAVCQAPRLRGTCGTYVETEVADRLRISKPEEEFDPFGNFTMDLMVQNVVLEEKPESEGKSPEEEKPKEKIERLPVLEGICKYAAGHVLLVGRPGSGKTTALDRLLVQEAEVAWEDSSARIPVLIRLRDLRSTVLQQIQKELQALGLRLTTEKIADLLWAGRFLVLLDGVNELPNGEMRQEVESFRREYQQKTPMIFTTRELNVGLDLGIEKKLEMQPLNERQMQEFTCRYLGQVQGQQLIKGLGQRLREFGETPLLLWMLCGVFRAVGEIPANLGGVFRGFANIYNKNRFDNQKSSEYSRFLQQLAWAMMPQNDPQGLRLSIPRSEAEEIFREFRKAEQEGNALSGAIATLDELLRFHLLRPKDNQEVEFSHQLFQEYYAGEYLLSRLPKLTDLELQKCYLNYLDWTEAIALMAGLVGDRSQAVRLVNLGLEVDLMLGARLAGEVLPQFQEETVGLVTNLDLHHWLRFRLWKKIKSDRVVDSLTKALQHSHVYVRCKAAEALGSIGNDLAANSLILALEDQDEYVRSKVVEALRNIGTDRAAHYLTKALQDQDGDVRRCAAGALENISHNRNWDSFLQYLDEDVSWNRAKGLGNIGSDHIVDSLILALQDQDEDICRNVAKALKNIGSEQVVDALTQALQDQDMNKDVRRYAAEVLGEIASDGAVDALTKALQDQSGDVRRNAVEALGKSQSLSWKVIVGNSCCDEVVDSLIKATQDHDEDVQRNAVEALGKLWDVGWNVVEGNTYSNGAVDALTKALQNQNEDVWRKAIEALSRIGSERAIDSLILALQNQNEDVRCHALEALDKINFDRAIDSLIEALQDQYQCWWLNKNEVAEELGNIGSRAVNALTKALQDQNEDVRRNALEALEKVSSDRAVDALIKTLHDQEEDTYGYFTKALGEIDSDDSVDINIDTSVEFFQDWGEDMYWYPAEELGKINGDNALDTSIDTSIDPFQDWEEDMYWYPAEELGKIDSDQTIDLDTLLETLQDQDSFAVDSNAADLRRNAAKALGEIGSDRAVDALILALQDQDYFVRCHAAEALREIGSDRAVDALILALQDQDLSVRYYASEALAKISTQALQDQGNDIYRNAAEAWGETSCDWAIDVHRNAAEVLRKIGSDQAVDALILALQDQYCEVRINAVKVLGNINSNRTINYLVKALNDHCGYVHWEAAVALGNLGIDQAINTLIFALQDQNRWLREEAVEALGSIGSDRAVDALTQALQDHDKYVRQKVVEALGKIGSDRAVDALTQALKDHDKDVRWEAVKALGKIGSERAIDSLMKVLVLQYQDSHVNKIISLSRIALEPLEKIGSDKLISRLWQICRSGVEEALDVVSKIQERYKLYNYEISQTPLPAITPTPNSVTYNIGQAGQIIQNQNVAGNNTGIQNL